MAEITERQLKNRFAELSRRAEAHAIYTETDFLSLAEQDLLLSLPLSCPCTLLGGYEGAERRIAVFGSEELTGYVYEAQLVCLQIAPTAQKFADKLGHRDILGAVMSLGLERKVTGDILLLENVAYLFCLPNAAEYIRQNLASVRHTAIRCTVCEPPKQHTQDAVLLSLTVASERLDALIAAVYKLGRTAAKELVQDGKVYLNSRLCENAGSSVAEGTIVSVRGFGRFRYEGNPQNTKKGRLRVLVKVY